MRGWDEVKVGRFGLGGKGRSFETSGDVTLVMAENRSPEWMGSGNGGGRLNWAILDIIVFFRLSILEVKKFKNEVDEILVCRSW